MCASGWPIMLLLFCLFGSATSCPISVYTPAPPLPSQISPPSPSPTNLPSLPSPSPVSPLVSNSEESTAGCPLTISPSALVVRFGDPVKVNCSVQRMGLSVLLLGWEVPVETTIVSTDGFVVWSVNRMTEWILQPMCFTISDPEGHCHINLTLTVYKPPDYVSISLVDHGRTMIEGHQYTLQCTVQNVAPVEKLIVTFYRGQTALGQPQSKNDTVKTPVTETFTLDITATKEDDGVQYWCEAKLELGPEGPQPPPVVTSQKFTAMVLFGPQLACPTKLQVTEGEGLGCGVRGNPQPFITWFRDGQVIALPSHLSREHAGKYTVLAKGSLGQKNFTVEVDVLARSGTANSSNGHRLLTVFLIQMIKWL